MILSYSEKENKIIVATNQFNILFKLGEYYKGAVINEFEYLKNGVIKFVVNKEGMMFEDYLSIIDTLCKEPPNEIKDKELEEILFLERDDRWEFESNIDLKEVKKVIIEFIRNLKEEV